MGGVWGWGIGGGESQRRHTGIHNMHSYDVEVGREQLSMGDREGDENKEHGIIYNEQYRLSSSD